MAKVRSASAALAKLAQNRDAIRAQAAALDAEEKALRKALSREGAEALATAFGKLDLGEVSKPQAAKFARRVQQLGLSESLARLETK